MVVSAAQAGIEDGWAYLDWAAGKLPMSQAQLVDKGLIGWRYAKVNSARDASTIGPIYRTIARLAIRAQEEEGSEGLTRRATLGSSTDSSRV